MPLPSNLIEEFEFRFARSSGKGGQNVNKVESKVEVYFNIQNSNFLDDDQKELLVINLKNRISAEDTIKVTSEVHRSQLKNRKEATEKLLELIEKGLTKKKPRKKTRKPQSANEKRISQKKLIGETKKLRRKPGL